MWLLVSVWLATFVLYESSSASDILESKPSCSNGFAKTETVLRQIHNHLTPVHLKCEAFWRSSVMRSKYRGQGSHSPPSSNVGSFQHHHYCSFNAPFGTFPCYLCTLFCLRFPPLVMNILPCFSGFSLRNNRSRAQGFSATQHDPGFLVPISGVWWVRCLWLLTSTSKSRVNSNVSAKFFDTMHIIIHAFFLFIVVQLNTFCVLWIPRNFSWCRTIFRLFLYNSKSTSPIDPYVFR